MKQLDISLHTNRDFIISYKGEEIGRQHYPKWSSSKAVINIGSNEYLLEPRGFWQTMHEVMENGNMVLQMQIKWSGGTQMHKPKEPHHFYMFNLRGFFKSGYILSNYKGEELLEIKTDFSIKKFSTSYLITCNDTFGDTDFEKLLIMLSVSCYRQGQRTAAAAAAT